MKAPRTHLILVLDGSYSMQRAYSNMTKGVNRIIASLADFENLTVDLWQFSDRSWRDIDNLPIGYIPVLDIQWGKSGTALNATLEHAIEAKLTDGLDMEEAVLMLLITDGENGVYSTFPQGPSAELLKQRIELLRDSGQWHFTVFAAPVLGTRRRSAEAYLADYGLDYDCHEYVPGQEEQMWDLIQAQLGDYMHARQGGTVPDHLRD